MMLDSSDKFFYNTLINRSFDNSCANDNDVFMAATVLIHDYNESQRPKLKGSIKGHEMVDHKREVVHV